MNDKPKVLFVAAELNPIAKVGGLADVIGALPKALAKLGVDVRITIPKYGIIDEKKYPLQKVARNINVLFSGQNEAINVYKTPLPDTNIPVYLIDNLKYLGKNGVYFEKDASSSGSLRESQRFTFYVKSSLEIFNSINWWPDIIHFHDWHVGILAVLLRLKAKKDELYKNIRTLLTIHNMSYQGKYNPQNVFNNLNIKEDDFPTLKIRTGENQDINYLQQAILTADLINAVSPTYSQEILTPEFGEGLESTLRSRKSDLYGILNGIDIDRFNPETDKNIIKNYSAKNLEGKKKCKTDLQKTCNFKVDEKIPIFSIVSRLADQKGIDLILANLDKLMKENAQFVLLGTGNPAIENQVKNAISKYKDKIFAKIDFDAHFAQQIYAGANIFLIPSRFEPCGLGQMIAMRYGTVPIARATGGLKDTVEDYNEKTEKGDGFIFQNYNAGEFWQALTRALKLYQSQKKWYKLIVRIMQKDFSWNKSAEEYLKLYQRLI